MYLLYNASVWNGLVPEPDIRVQWIHNTDFTYIERMLFLRKKTRVTCLVADTADMIPAADRFA